MAVPISNVTRRVVYAASGTGPYAFTFEILANTDIAVYKDDTLLTLTTDYTVTIASNGTGSITLVASPTGATQIAIVGNRTIQRTTDFVTGGDFFANTVNDEMDQQTIFAQQNAEGLLRALQAPQTDPTTINMTLPRAADRANKYLAFDADGNPEPGETAVEVAAVYAIRDDIAAVAAIDTDVTTVADNIDDITSILAVVDDIATVGAIADDIAAVAAIDSDVTAVAANDTNIDTVAGISANVTTVAGISANVTTVAGMSSAISTVNSNSTNINTVAGISANVTTVAGISAAVSTVAADGTDIGTVAGISADVQAVADIAADVSAVENIAANVTTVAGISSNVTTVAGISSAVSGVAAISSAVSSVNSNSTNINTCATNITAINDASTQATNAASSATAAAASATAAAASYDSFDDRYLGAKSSAPSVDNDGNALLTGAIYWNTSLGSLYIWTGSAWTQAAFEVSGGVSSFNTRDGAVTLSSTDVSDALGFTPSSTGKSVAMAIVFGG